MKISFRRITSSGTFIPEIDGLRFIAISSVVLFHIRGFLLRKDTHEYLNQFNFHYLDSLLSKGDLGVPLFFVISGFILGIPFIRGILGLGNKVTLKTYFLRRLTRLEPPYFLVMSILFAASVFVARNLSFSQGVKSYFASMTYTHNFFFPGKLPLLNAPAWSLEIEVQFYILAPILAYLFFRLGAKLRRSLLILFTLFFVVANNFFPLPFLSLYNFIHYFLIGFLLADYYISKTSIIPRSRFDYIIGIILFSLIWIFENKSIHNNFQKILLETGQLFCIFFFYYFVLFKRTFHFLSNKFFTNIGGMCYSIYLIHLPLISLFGNPLLKITFSPYSYLNVPIYFIILISIILIISSIYFLLIERPCMDKDWIKKLFKKRYLEAPSVGGFNRK